jgi:hypothetical protein
LIHILVQATNGGLRHQHLPQGRGMKAFLIDPVTQRIELIECSEQPAEWAQRIGAKAVEFDDISKTTDRLCFDEDCFITQKPGRFQLDTLAPVAGSAMIVGAQAADGTVAEPAMTIDEIRARVRFL